MVFGAAAVLVAVIGGVSACNDRAEEQRSAQRSAAIVDRMKPRTVTYQVLGDGTRFSMTATTPTGTVQQTPDLPLRTKDYGLFQFDARPGEFLYLSAQNVDGYEITCQITVNGKVISENTSTGKYSIATCRGSVD